MNAEKIRHVFLDGQGMNRIRSVLDLTKLPEKESDHIVRGYDF